MAKGFQKGNKLRIGLKPSNAFVAGFSPWNKGKKGLQTAWNKDKKLSQEHKKKLSESHKGYKMTESQKQKISLSHIGKHIAEKNNAWKGGISFKKYTIDWTETLRRSIRERDNYVCQLCKKIQGDKAFSIHHIDYNKKNNNTNNLITLCINCHMKTNFCRSYWIKLFIQKNG